MTFCLQSVFFGQIVTMLPCFGPFPGTTWTVYGETNDPATRYHIVDSQNRCLALTNGRPWNWGWFWYDITPPIYRAVVEPCAAKPNQMWNVPPAAMAPVPLKDIGDI